MLIELAVYTKHSSYGTSVQICCKQGCFQADVRMCSLFFSLCVRQFISPCYKVDDDNKLTALCPGKAVQNKLLYELVVNVINVLTSCYMCRRFGPTFRHSVNFVCIR